MIKSLVLNGMHNIDADALNRIEIEDTKLSIKDIPYVRYQILSNGTNDEKPMLIDENVVAYLKKSMQKFPYSVHIIDVPLTVSSADNIQCVQEEFNNGGEDVNLAVMLKINASSKMLDDCSQEIRDTLNNIDFNDVWRVVLVDKDQEITDVTRMDEIMNNVYEMFPSLKSKKKNKIALCNSPLLAGAGVDGVMGIKGCLPASEIRELQIYKSEEVEIPLVTEGHQNVGTPCGCAQFALVTGDIKVTKPAKAGGGSKKGSNKSGEKSDKAVKKAVKKSGPPAIF